MDQAALDAAYNNQAAVPDFAGWTRAKRAASEALHHRAQRNLRYGEGQAHRLDFYAAARAPAPLLVFIHGGYWQGGSKDTTGFLAEGPMARGFHVAVVEYTLAPAARIDGMVADVAGAIRWMRRHAAELGFDPARIVLAGHSAGAQLLCHVLNEQGVLGGMAISGIYDLEPIRLSYLDRALRLTPDEVERLSPARRGAAIRRPLVVAAGEDELPELVRQSRQFALDMRRAGCPVSHLPLAGHDHFSVLDELARADGQLCRRLESTFS